MIDEFQDTSTVQWKNFKVLLRELQSLGLDMRVLRDDNTEVEIVESTDYADTDLRSVIEGDSRNYRNEESFANSGYTTQEFDENEELVDVVDDDSYDDDESYDDTDE